MAIITTVNQFDFVSAFQNSNTYKDNFSYEGLHLLFELLDNFSTDTGEELEFDLVGFCSDFAESTLLEFIQNYADCQEDYNNAELTHIEFYLNEYIDSNFTKIMSDQDIRKKYFSFLENDSIKENDNFIIELMVNHLIDSMNHKEFLKLICEIENDQDYMEAIDSIMYDVVREYLDNAGGLYMISDCRTIVVYQDF